MQGAPRHLSGAFVSDGAITLTWAPPQAGSFSGSITEVHVRFQPLAPPGYTWAFGNTTFQPSIVILGGAATSYTHPISQLVPYTSYSVKLAILTDTSSDLGPFSEPITIEHTGELPSGQPRDVIISQPAVDPTSFPPIATQLIVEWKAPVGLWLNNTPIYGFEVTATSTALTTPKVNVEQLSWLEDDPSDRKFTTAFTELNPHTEYTVHVRSLGMGGPSTPSESVIGKTRDYFPSISPQNVTMVTRTPHSLFLRWDEISSSHPGSNGEIVGYSIHHVPTADIDCVGVRCVRTSECQELPRCEFGECIYTNKPNGTLCDDGNVNTVDDVCMDGLCIGMQQNEHISHGVLTRTLSMNTRSHGAGFIPWANEFWFPLWSGTTIYRFDSMGHYLGTFSTSQNNIMQVWADNDPVHYYYLARWSSRDCVKIGPYPATTVIWRYSTPSNTGGVSTDDNYAYCIPTSSNLVYVLDKETGSQVNTITLSGGATSTLYGAFFVVKDKIYYGTGNRMYRYSLVDGTFDNFQFQMQVSITNIFFTGQDVCVSTGSTAIYCYRVCLKRSLKRP